MRAAVYTRVSQDRNEAGRSVTQQEDECRAVAAREGWTIARTFTDNDRSASRYSKKTRPAYAQLRQFISDGHCDVLITWEASRSTRDLATFVELRDLCRDRGVKLSYSGRLYDLTDDADQFMTGLDALLAEQESARTSKRIQRAVRANAAAGRPHGRNLYGYRRTYDPNSGQLLSVEIEEREAAMLREAADRALAGESLYAILIDLNARGYRTRQGSPWVTSTIRRCLVNPAYAGKRVLRGEVVSDAIWPAIHDEDTYWRLRALLDDPNRDTARGQHDVRHLLSGLARCGICGGPMRVLTNRGTRTYTCAPGLGHLVRRKEPVDDLVTRVLLARLAAPDLAAARTDQPRAARSEDHTQALAKRARLQTFYDSAADGGITAAALTRIEQKLLTEIDQHERAARRAATPHSLAHLADTDIPTEWPDLPIGTQRAIVKHYLDITILPAGKGRRTFNPDLIRIEWR